MATITPDIFIPCTDDHPDGYTDPHFAVNMDVVLQVLAERGVSILVRRVPERFGRVIMHGELVVWCVFSPSATRPGTVAMHWFPNFPAALADAELGANLQRRVTKSAIDQLMFGLDL